jgi:shikimate dehydrogenase
MSTKRYGLIGYPLGHSFSKQYFDAKFEREGIEDAVFELFPIEQIQDLPALLQQYPDLCGLAVTIPYKKQVLAYVQHQTDAVKAMGACNSLVVRHGALHAHNTDVLGFEQSLLQQLHSSDQRALILGTGGAAAAVAYVLQKNHIQYQFVSRNAGQGALGYAQLSQALLVQHQLIVNTTPLGTFPNTAGLPDLPYQFIGDQHFLFDLVYNPPMTAFLQKGGERGARIQNGYDMLVAQAEASWTIWNQQ